MAARNAAPVIIKKKKVVAGDGHHGGAWKVAYADFVTAMMAFFMLMWLLNATTEKQRKGLADYFNPTIPVNRISGGGDGAFGGDNIFAEMALAQSGTGASVMRPTEEVQSKGQSGVDTSQQREIDAQDQMFANVEADLKAMSGESMASDDVLRHIVTRVTDEGLIIELYDQPGQPLFMGQSAEPRELTRRIAGILAEVFALAKNGVAIGGHTKAYPAALLHDPAWDLSTARAQAMRTMLADAGLEERRVERVTGFADRTLAARDPMAVRNNRIEVILLRDKR